MGITKGIDMVIGVVGTFASGKDTVAEYIASKGYTYFATADEIRHDMVAEGIPVDRDSMTAYVTQKRAEHGNAYFTRRVIAKISGDAVFASMRHPDEVRELQKLADFYLIAVDAPIELRFQRAQLRKRIGDGETLESFRAKEEREMTGATGGHQLGEVIAMADYQISNRGTLEELHAKTDELLEKLQGTRKGL